MYPSESIAVFIWATSCAPLLLESDRNHFLTHFISLIYSIRSKQFLRLSRSLLQVFMKSIVNKFNESHFDTSLLSEFGCYFWSVGVYQYFCCRHHDTDTLEAKTVRSAWERGILGDLIVLWPLSSLARDYSPEILSFGSRVVSGSHMDCAIWVAWTVWKRLSPSLYV